MFRRSESIAPLHSAPASPPARGGGAWVLGLIMAAGLALGPGVAPGQTPSADFFPIAVFYQPVSGFDTWRARGVNTVLGYEPDSGRYSYDDFDNAAAARGLYTIREPRPDPRADVGNSRLLAWLSPVDEPETKGVPASYQQQQYNALKAIDPTRPVFTTYSGGYVIGWQANMGRAEYQPYLNATDWVGADLYPVTGWNSPELTSAVGQMVGRLVNWSGGKTNLAFIETSNQRLPYTGPNSRGVTPGEFRGEVWDAVIHGARAIGYFADTFSPTTGGFVSYDGTPDDVAAEMTAQDKLLKAMGKVLLSAPNPAGISFRPGDRALEGAWRQVDGIDYLFVLNLSPDALTDEPMTLTGVRATALNVPLESRAALPLSGNQFTDSFGPYELHVYTADTMNLSRDLRLNLEGFPQTAPEPGTALLFIPAIGAALLRRSRR